MAKTKFKKHKDAGKVMREHKAEVLAAVKECLQQESDKNEVYSDEDIAEMICGTGLLTSKNAIYKIRIDHEIPNSREREVINFAQLHKK